MREEGEARDEAAAAFEALQASVEAQAARLADEMAALRVVFNDRLGKPLQVRMPDYAPTFAALAEQLERLEARPVPKVDASAVAAVLKDPMAAVSASMSRMERVATDMERVTATFESEQDLLRARHQWGARGIGVGVLGGVLLYVLLAGPIARGMPVSWAAPEKMAAATLASTRWGGGGRMMQSADPVSWERMAEGADLMNTPATGDALRACKAKAKSSGKAQRCTIQVDAPVEHP